MNELIRISENKVGDNLIQTVNAKELHAYLGNKQDFSHWIKARITTFDFMQDVDFIDVKIIVNDYKGLEVVKSIEYYISIDMAKELSMMERTEKGKEIRKYFIECERVAKSVAMPSFEVPKTLSQALRLAADLSERNEALGLKIETDRPLVEFATAVSECRGCTISEFAKVVNIKGIGRNNMFKKLIELGYLMQNKEPYQRWLNSGLFERIERTPYRTPLGIFPSFKTLITGKGQIVIEKALRAELLEVA